MSIIMPRRGLMLGSCALAAAAALPAGVGMAAAQVPRANGEAPGFCRHRSARSR